MRDAHAMQPLQRLNQLQNQEAASQVTIDLHTTNESLVTNICARSASCMSVPVNMPSAGTMWSILQSMYGR